MPNPFTKPALATTDQITLLKQRGLDVPKTVEAEAALKRIGYYRLSGYMLPFQTGGGGLDRHNFKQGTQLGDVLRLYDFDRKLRLVCLDALERIEVGVRAALTSAMAVPYGAHWYMYPHNFVAKFDHATFLERAKAEMGEDGKRRDLFIDHYYRKYDSPDMPPSWMAFEALSFGTVSHLISQLTIPNRKKVAGYLNMPEPILRSWCHSLSYLRNLCAHHCRLWNRTFTIKPAASQQFQNELRPNDRAYAQLVTVQVMMKAVSPQSRWADRLKGLFAEHPEMLPQRLGFLTEWEKRPPWM